MSAMNFLNVLSQFFIETFARIHRAFHEKTQFRYSLVQQGHVWFNTYDVSRFTQNKSCASSLMFSVSISFCNFKQKESFSAIISLIIIFFLLALMTLFFRFEWEAFSFFRFIEEALSIFMFCFVLFCFVVCVCRACRISANHMFEFASSDQSIERIQNLTIIPSKRHVYRGKGAYYISLLF